MSGHTLILRTKADVQRLVALAVAAGTGAVATIRKATRSTEQNAKMQAMLSDVSRAKPMGRTLPPEHWKCLFMDDLGFKPNWIPGLDGDTVVNTGYRSSRLTVAQMSDLIERMYAFGAEKGVEWSDPETRQNRKEAA